MTETVVRPLLLGTLIGLASVPFMTWCSVPVKRAIGTSAAIGLPIAVGGAVGYIIAGWNEPSLPPWSFGYVVLPGLRMLWGLVR